MSALPKVTVGVIHEPDETLQKDDVVEIPAWVKPKTENEWRELALDLLCDQIRALRLMRPSTAPRPRSFSI